MTEDPMRYNDNNSTDDSVRSFDGRWARAAPEQEFDAAKQAVDSEP